jgi:hypothetical protein
MEALEGGSLGTQLWRWLDTSRVGETVLQYATDALQPWEEAAGTKLGAAAPGEGPPSVVPVPGSTFQPLPLVPHGVLTQLPSPGEPGDDDELFAPGSEPRVTAPPGYTWPGGSLELRVQPHKAGDDAEVLYTVSWRSTLTQGCVFYNRGLRPVGDSGVGALDWEQSESQLTLSLCALLCSRYTSSKGAVCRRVADFEWLRRRLVEEYDGLCLPCCTPVAVSFGP